MEPRCYHCHEPVPRRGEVRATVSGSERRFCCRGCAAVAEFIDASGLARFYALRQEAPARPDEERRRWDAFDRPAIAAAVTQPLPDGSRELFCAVPAVRCAACSWLIESALADLEGLVELSVNPATARLRAVFREPLALSRLLARLEAIGYRPQPLTPDATLTQQRRERDAALRRIVVAGIGMMQVMMYAIALYAGYFEGMDAATRDFFRLFSLIVATPVVFYAGWPFFRGAWRGLRTGRPGMDLPVAIAVGAAYGASAWTTFAGGREVYFDSAVMFVFFLSIARWIEMRLRHQAFELGYGAGEELPQHAQRWHAGAWETVALAELEPGDRIRVAANETVPADGRLRSETARVDEALLTGEARPVPKARGDRVIAGALVLGEAVELVLERTGRETLLSAIRRLLERARAARPRQLALADRLAGILVFLILAIAAGTWLSWRALDPARAFEVTLAVLVITCPCALSLATPSALSAAIARLLREGVLVVAPSSLETLARVDRVVFDKTGTLTTGALRLLRTELAAGADLDAGAAARIAAALELGSRHPIATAFAPAAEGQGATEVREVPGRGIEGAVDGRVYRIGRADFVAPAPGGPGVPDGEGVVLGTPGRILARFMLAEAERPDARRTLAAIERPVALLSGDAEAPVRALADRLGLTDVHWRQTPEDKLAFVAAHQARGERVLMVGDGSNDAPVLAGADVSIAVGHGSALASRQADVILLGDRLASVAFVLEQARTTRTRIRQNLAWALSYNLLAVPAAATGLVPPWLAAIGMSLSSLLVVLNSLRTARAPQAADDAVPGRLSEVVP